MRVLRAIVVENDLAWQALIGGVLDDIDGMTVDYAVNVAEAWRLLGTDVYDLISIDLSLVADVSSTAITDLGGFELLDRVRAQPRGTSAALLIITGHSSEERIRRAFAKYHVDDFLTKREFDDEQFKSTVKRALFDSRVRSAEDRRHRQHRLTISVIGARFVGADLSGPLRSGGRLLEGNGAFPAEDFADRADGLNVMILNGDSVWRSAARSIGESLYGKLAGMTEISELLIRSLDLSTAEHPIAIQITGPSSTLRVPFELMTDGNDYLSLSHAMSRRIAAPGVPPTRRGEPFHEFIANLVRQGEPLRILLVAANSDGSIPLVYREIEGLKERIERTLDIIGVEHAVETLSGGDATYAKVRDRLRNGRAHLFHYAGHGRFDDKLPEISGLVLGSGKTAPTVSAAALKQLVEDTELRFAFLSCCVGARTAQQIGQGDFHGTIDALTRGDVPATLGFRWVVPDESGCRFALSFYDELLHTLSFGVALLRTRRMAADDSLIGRNNSTWASPILVNQAG
jgi:CheY-like chemotaxis protein